MSPYVLPHLAAAERGVPASGGGAYGKDCALLHMSNMQGEILPLYRTEDQLPARGRDDGSEEQMELSPRGRQCRASGRAPDSCLWLNRFSADRGIHGSRGYPLCLQVTLLAKTGSGYHPQRAVSYVARCSLRVVAATSLSEQWVWPLPPRSQT